jgi:hypothetical protein
VEGLGVATQRLTVAALAGQAAVAVAARFGQWRATPPDPETVDRFCVLIREHALSPPVVYFAEWVDHWLIGDLVPGPGAVEGRQFQVTGLSRVQAVAWAERCGDQFPEQLWLASRLREAATGWGAAADRYAVVVAREVVATSISDDEVRAALGRLPAWLSSSDPG